MESRGQNFAFSFLLVMSWSRVLVMGLFEHPALFHPLAMI
jgi:hypothetical protein